MKKFLVTIMAVVLTAGMLAGCGSGNGTSTKQQDESQEQSDYSYGLTYYIFGNNIAYGVSSFEISGDTVKMKCDYGDTDYSEIHTYNYKLSDNYVFTSRFKDQPTASISSDLMFNSYWEGERERFVRMKKGEKGLKVDPYSTITLIGHYDENQNILIDDIRYDFIGRGMYDENLSNPVEYKYNFDRFSSGNKEIEVD